MKKILIFITTFIFIAIIILVNLHSIKIYRVASPSMEPTILKESILIVKEDTNYKTGDIATYKTLQNTHPITHRIVSIFKIQDKHYFNFKGDANENMDPYPVLETEIIGKYIFSIPYLGKATYLFKNPENLFIFLSVPTGLVSGKMFKKFLFIS